MKFADGHARVADRLQARGVPVQRQPGWAQRGAPDGRGRARDVAAVQSLVVHHTATGGKADLPTLHMLTYGRPDPQPLDGPLSQWAAGRNGTLALVAAGLANHAGATWEPWQGNSYSVGIECENNGIGEPWNPVMVASMVAWAQEMRHEFGIPASRVMGHREICKPAGRKIDPANFDMNAFRKLTDYPNLEDDLNTEQDRMLREIHAVLIGEDSVASRVDGRRMPWRTMLEYIDENLYNLLKRSK